MAYRIELTKSAIKELERLPARSHDKIVEHLVQLEQDPRLFGAEKLTGIDAYTLRVGNYRIVYEINDVQKRSASSWSRIESKFTNVSAGKNETWVSPIRDFGFFA